MLAVHMWPTMGARVTGCAVLLFLLSGPVGATSIVVQLDPDRILIAADTHGYKLGPDLKSSNETECKIVPFNNAAFERKALGSSLVF
jgi:hypothetical protein